MRFCPCAVPDGARVKSSEHSLVFVCTGGMCLGCTSFKRFSPYESCCFLIYNGSFDTGSFYPQSQVAVDSIYLQYTGHTHTHICRCMPTTYSPVEVLTSMLAAPWVQHSAIVVTNVNYYPAVDTITAAHSVNPRCLFPACCL